MAKKKRSLLERINPFDKESRGRRAGKKAAKATKGMIGFGLGVPSPPPKAAPKKKPARSTRLKTKKEQYEAGQKSKHASVRKATKAGAIKEGIIPKKTVKTKGGDYPVYAKKSKTAKSFRSTFKSKCAGKGAGDSFSWQGRRYSCKKK